MRTYMTMLCTQLKPLHTSTPLAGGGLCALTWTAMRGPWRFRPAKLLESIGERQDVPRLRALAKSGRRTPIVADLGRSLSRRVAHRIWIEDQARVSIQAGDRVVPGTTIRRKVLALLCFLISRGFSATRDQVLDALWPELDPEIAVNSLNQTLYFLRRVFEEDYTEDLSPGYVWHDSDLVWLDEELVDTRTAQIRRLLRRFDPPEP